jgi:hypothetical protein
MSNDEMTDAQRQAVLDAMAADIEAKVTRLPIEEVIRQLETNEYAGYAGEFSLMAIMLAIAKRCDVTPAENREVDDALAQLSPDDFDARCRVRVAWCLKMLRRPLA